jgi:hypothetical protein
MDGASGREGQPGYRGKVEGWLSKVFELNPSGLNWPQAVLFLDVALVPLIPASEHGLRLFAVSLGLEVVALVLFTHGAAIRFWNYALYNGAIAAGVLILLDLPQPANYAAEGYRVLWTLCGVAIGVLVMLLAGLVARRTAKSAPRQAPQPA